jgi:hypothetical protein
MKIGYSVVLAGLLAAVLLVPVAAAKPGNGNGNGNGPPAWAGGGNGGSKAKGKPDQIESKKAQKAARQEERRAAHAAAQESDEDEPKHQNPAWVCKFEREQMGAEAFADEYGTNENETNAFGKCVSEEAHDRDGVADDEGPEENDSGEEQPSVPDDSEDEDAGRADALAAVQAFLQSLVQLVF